MVVAHLANLEPLYLARLERILQQYDPFLPSLSPDQASAHAATPLENLLAYYKSGRSAILRLLYPVRPEDWQRPARHERQGATTLIGQVQALLKHDQAHLGQLVDLRYAWERLGADRPSPGKRTPTDRHFSEEANHAT